MASRFPAPPRHFLPVIMLCFMGGTARLVIGAEKPVNFNQDIRAILSNACIQCHGPDPAERKGGPKGSGGLRLDTEEGSRMDLGGTAAIRPGHPELSELMARITSTDPDEVMPPPNPAKKSPRIR